MNIMWAVCKRRRVEHQHGIIEQGEYMRTNGAWTPIETRYHNWDNAMLLDKKEAVVVVGDLRAANIDAYSQMVKVIGGAT